MTNKISFTINSELNVVMSKLANALCYEDLYQHTLELMAHPQYKPGINGLYDFRLVNSLSGDEAVWQSLAQGVSSHEVISEPCSVAILVSRLDTDVAHELKKFIAMTKSSKIDYKLFTSDRFRSALFHVKLFNITHLEQLGL